MNFLKINSLMIAGLLIAPASLLAHPLVEKCFEEVSLIESAILKDYATKLKDLRTTFQKGGDLDGYLAADKEIKRFEKKGGLSKANVVDAQGPLRWVQEKHLQEIDDQTYRIAQKFINQLMPQQEELTRSGEIEKAIGIKQAIETIKVQYEHIFAELGGLSETSGQFVVADKLAAFCLADEEMAEQTLRGKRILIRGMVDEIGKGFSDVRYLHIYLRTSQPEEKRINFIFDANSWKWDPLPGGDQLKGIFTSKIFPDQPPVHAEVGREIEISGVYEGSHLDLMFSQPSFPPESSVNQYIELEDKGPTKKKK